MATTFQFLSCFVCPLKQPDQASDIFTWQSMNVFTKNPSLLSSTMRDGQSMFYHVQTLMASFGPTLLVRVTLFSSPTCHLALSQPVVIFRRITSPWCTWRTTSPGSQTFLRAPPSPGPPAPCPKCQGQYHHARSICWGLKMLKRYLINYPHLSDYGQTIFVFLFRRGTEHQHQGDMNNSTTPNMFLIHKK
jgi:hypothetical protein